MSYTLPHPIGQMTDSDLMRARSGLNQALLGTRASDAMTQIIKYQLAEIDREERARREARRRP
jgi:hypothetical protein